MKIKKTIYYCCLLSALITISAPASAAFYDKDGLQVYGDIRLRIETDYQSNKADGTMRHDRVRLRTRGRLGVNYSFLDYFSVGTRIRTGSNASQQSPHITLYDFNTNPTGSNDVNFDKWFLKGKFKNESGEAWGWAGRNGLPFWKQNELFWDDDVTPVGFAAGYKFKLDKYQSISINSAYLLLPSGMRDLAGDMFAGQLVYSSSVKDDTFTFASGIYAMGADGNATDLLKGNGLRDYTIVQTSAQLKSKVFDIPIKVGADYIYNMKGYSSLSPIAYTAMHHNHRQGFILSTALGKLKKQNDWLVGYTYAYIEALAINSSYAQDDWVRWGSATQTRGSDMKGHEIRLGYSVMDNANLLLRYYIADAISTSEDGKRVRLDFNIKF
ncbi:MAG: putative porin [Methylococcales bacterium]|nr:putative porin [Methylococcales bacterium]